MDGGGRWWWWPAMVGDDTRMDMSVAIQPLRQKFGLEGKAAVQGPISKPMSYVLMSPQPMCPCSSFAALLLGASAALGCDEITPMMKARYDRRIQLQQPQQPPRKVSSTSFFADGCTDALMHRRTDAMMDRSPSIAPLALPL